MEDQIVMLKPEQVLADENTRFGLKPIRIDRLSDSILQEGGVLENIGVLPIVPPENGYGYRLVFGAYRHASVEKLNREQKAGLLLPARILSPMEASEFIKKQVAENAQREDLSPMDKAVAIQKLLDSGVSKVEVRNIFAAATGRKSLAFAPMSNAMLNIYLNFLELPKAIQEKIHDGRIGVGAAYELGKVPPEKRADVLASAEKDRQADMDRMERDEEKFLNSERKATEAIQKAEDAVKALDSSKGEIEDADKIVAEKTAALREVQKLPWLEMDEKGKKETTEKLKASENDLKAAQKLAKDAKNDHAKALKKAGELKELAAKRAKELEEARKAKMKGKGKGPKAAGLGAKEVQKAAIKEGVDGHVPLSLADIRSACKDVRSQTGYPRVAAIGKLFSSCFDGKLTPKELVDEVAMVTGELVRMPIAREPSPPVKTTSASSASAQAPPTPPTPPTPQAPKDPKPDTSKLKTGQKVSGRK